MITGAGEEYVSAAADMLEFNGEPQRAADYMSAFSNTFRGVAGLPGLTVAVVISTRSAAASNARWHAILRIVEEHAVVGLPEDTVSVLPYGGDTQRLLRLVGTAWAKRIVLLAERLDVRRALRIGLVDEVAASGAGLEGP